MLGRGLESLIPKKDGGNNPPDFNFPKISRPLENQPPAPSYPSQPQITRPEPRHQQTSYPSKEESIYQIEVDKIVPNPHQPRKVFDQTALEELASSIREMGVIQPIIVSKVMRDTDTGTEVEYQLIAGERRLKASRLAGLERIPAIIRDISEEKGQLEMAIVENVQRADLNPIEAARSYAKLQEEFGLTQREVASRVGKSRETIANVLRLLNLPSFMQDAIMNRKISDSQGRLLLSVTDLNQQKTLFDEIINNNLSVRDLKNKVANLRRPQSISMSSAAIGIDPHAAFIGEKLRDIFGTKVALQKTSAGGKITISFFSDSELQDILNKLKPHSLDI